VPAKVDEAGQPIAKPSDLVPKPSDLVQGTLEMLILKTLALEPMPMVSRCALSRSATAYFASIPAHCFRRLAGWNAQVA
jgi:hypothetical protein